MPAHTDGANGTGMGTQTPTPKYGVMSPFHAGGGGGGGGGGGAATQEFDSGSKTVPMPHSAALLTPGNISVTYASGATAIAVIVAKRRINSFIAGPPITSRSPTSNRTANWQPITPI